MHICPKCDHKFSPQEVYCEDWRDKNRSLGCPACKTFLRNKPLKNGEIKRIVIVPAVFVVLQVIIFLFGIPHFERMKAAYEQQFLIAKIGFYLFLSAAFTDLVYKDIKKHGIKGVLRPKRQNPLEVVDESNNHRDA